MPRNKAAKHTSPQLAVGPFRAARDVFASPQSASVSSRGREDRRKQMDRAQPKWEGELIYVRQQVVSHQRSRLIEQRVPFLVPGNQLYLPMLGIDLREHFRKQRQTPLTFKPATQTLVLELLLSHDTDAVTPTDLVDRLGYSKMSMSRAFDELEVEQLCEVSKQGRERHLRMTSTRKVLWEKAMPLMQSPVQRRSWIRRNDDLQAGITAGLSALAKYSMLAAPNTPTIAVSKDRWKSMRDKDIHGRAISDDPDAVEVKVWTYDPELFAKDGIADRFSLFLALQGSKDERVEAALDEMLEAIFIGILLFYIFWLTACKLRDPDEVKSAALIFSMNFGSWMGLATAVIAVALMLAVPGLADFKTRIAIDAKNEISPANAGFALGVLFTVVGTLVFSVVGYTSWWLARR